MGRAAARRPDNNGHRHKRLLHNQALLWYGSINGFEKEKFGLWFLIFWFW